MEYVINCHRENGSSKEGPFFYTNRGDVSITQSLGVNLETISHLVGHTTTRITESRYLRVQNEACQDALERFDQRFGFGS